MKKNGIQFLKFGIVGLSNSIMTFLVYSILIFFGSYYLVANVIGYCAGVVNSYIWNSKFVFKRQQSKVLFTKFMLVNLITLSINTILLYILIDKLNYGKYVGQMITISISMIINFMLNKFWTFKKIED